MAGEIEIFGRKPREIIQLYGAPLGTAPGGPMPAGRANAKGCLKLSKDTGAYNVEIGFDAEDEVCYALFEKKNRGALEDIEVRQLLLQCAAGAEWTDVTATAWNPRTKKTSPPRGFRDYQYREPAPDKSIKKILLARRQFHPGRLAVWTLGWQADIEKELGIRIA